MRTRAPRTRKPIVLGLLTALVLASLLGAALYQAPDDVRLEFGAGRDGFQTMGGHGQSTPEALVEVVERTTGEYVESLDVLRPYTVVDTTVATPLLTVKVHVDALGVNHTYIDTGYANITVDGLLRGVPADQVDELIANVTAQGFSLVENLTAEESPSPSPSPSPTPTETDDPLPIPPVDPDAPFYFEYVDENGTRILVIAVSPGAERVDVIVYQGADYDGLHVTTTPFFVSHTSGDGMLLDLFVRNPIEATISAIDHPVTVRGVQCAQGECIPEAIRDLHDVCTTDGVCQDIPDVHITDLQHEGGNVALPGEILHVWSEDRVHGGAGIGILGDDTTLLAGSRWTGNPFDGGIVLYDNQSAVVGTLTVKVPTVDDPRVGFTLGGPVVQSVAGGDLAHHEDLDQYSVQVAWGPIHLGNQDAYRAFDDLNGLLVGTWSTNDGAIRGVHVTALANATTLVQMIEDASGVEVDIEPIRTRLLYHGSRIEAAALDLAAVAQGAPGPATRAVLDIVNITTGEASHQVTLIEGAIGCSLTTEGCIAIVIGPAGDVLEEAGLPPPQPGSLDPEALVNGLPVDADEVIVYANTVAGTVLGYLPTSDAPVPCLDASTPLTCLLSTQPASLAGAVVGFLGDSTPAFAAIVDDNNETIGVYDGQGRAVASYEAGTIHVAGHTALLGQDPLLTVTTPTGRTLCVRHTFDAAGMQNGGWPSVEAGCDGIAGETVVVQPGATYAFDGQGNLRELSLHDPANPNDVLLYYYDDGQTTTIVPHPASGADPVVLASTLVHVSGNPATSPTYRIDIVDETRSGGGILHGVGVFRDAWSTTERSGRTLLPGAVANAVFDVTHAPEVGLRVSDGRNTRNAALDGFGGSGWLSGLMTNHWLVEANNDAPAQLDLLYRVGDTPSIDGPRLPFTLTGFNATTGDRVYETTIQPSTLSKFQTGGDMRFQLAWTTRHGAVSLTTLDDNGGSDYRYRLDTDLPTASVTAPTASADSSFTVSWAGGNERGSGLGTFHVEVASGTTWGPWIGGRHVSEPQSATFTGQPGTNYTFRAKACDNVGNCGSWSSTATTAVAAAAVPPPTQAPTITVLAPTNGATVSGYVALAWSVDHDPSSEPIVTVAYQRAGASGWTNLYSGHRTSATWDTTNLWDGDHDLRYSVSDGIRTDMKTILVHVENGRTEPTLEIGSGSEGTGGGSLAPEGGSEPGGGKNKDTPMVGVPLVLIGVIGLLAVLYRRRGT